MLVKKKSSASFVLWFFKINNQTHLRALLYFSMKSNTYRTIVIYDANNNEYFIKFT